MYIHIHAYIRDLLEWLIGCGLWSFSNGWLMTEKAKDSVGAQPTRLDVSADPLWCCRIPRELPVFSLCWNPDEGGFNTSCSNRINELTCQCG